jgi:hypothetical protein
LAQLAAKGEFAAKTALFGYSVSILDFEPAHGFEKADLCNRITT